MINLLPPDVLENIRYGRHNWWLLKHIIVVSSCLVVLIGVGLASGVLMEQNKTALESDIKTSEASQAKFADTLSQGKELQTSLAAFEGLSTNAVRFSSLFERIAFTLPKGSVIGTIRLSDTSQSVDFTVQAKSNEIATSLQSNLEAKNEVNPFASATLSSLSCQTADGLTAEYPCTIGVKAKIKSDIILRNTGEATNRSGAAR